MEPVTAWVIIAAAGVVVVVVSILLVRHWNRLNAQRYPNRVSSRLFEINRRNKDG